MEEPFTNREIKEFMEDIRRDLVEIKLQVKTTNGRVSALENWKWLITGGMSVLTILVVPIVLYLITHWPLK